jgi:uncharacterized membrane protein YqjE
MKPFHVIRMLHSAGGALFTQAGLHGQLVRVEWEVEKDRLLKMLVTALLGFASVVCVMLFAGALVIAFSWDTAYRIPAAVTLAAVYALGAAIAWHRFKRLSALGSQAFAATREELAADLALLRSTH